MLTEEIPKMNDEATNFVKRVIEEHRLSGDQSGDQIYYKLHNYYPI